MRKIYTLLAAGSMAFTSMTGFATPLPAQLPLPSGDQTIIDEQPEGELTLYSRTCRAYRYFYGEIEQIIEEGSVVKYVEQEDGTVWLHNMISMFLAPGWIKAEKDGDKLTIQGPQLVYEEMDYEHYEETGEEVILKYYISPVDIIEFEDENGNRYVRYQPSEDGVFTFDIKDGMLKESGDGSTILGIITYSEKNGYFWVYYGDNYIVMTVPEANDVVVPATAEITTSLQMSFYNQQDQLRSARVDVAVDGDDYYIKGIYPSLPEVWVKGKRDGKHVCFPNFQMIGADLVYNYFIYLGGGQLDDMDDDEYYDDAVLDPEGFVLYVEEDGTLSAENYLIFVTSADTNMENANYLEFFSDIEIREVGEGSGRPTDPDEIFLGGMDGIPSIECNIPAFDDKGVMLETENMYFSVFVNNEIIVFTPEVYPDLPMFMGIDEPTTEIPYDCGNYGYDFFQEESWHTVFLVEYEMSQIYNIGVQSIYYPEGKDVNPENVYKSDIVFVGNEEDPNSVDEINANQISEVKFFDMQGRRIMNPTKGLFIKSVKYADGSVKTSKVNLR